MENNLQSKAVQTIRFLAADMVQKANSGHPGLPMGAAALAYTVWRRHLHHNPHSPQWVNRDRFVLSGGHGSALLYALLHLTGYDLSLSDLMEFRQLGSRTPGHPEYGVTPGVETTTGPLGQGFANGVGFAIAETHLAGVFNRDRFNIIDHYVYGIITDGDLMEGVTAEAASLAGHLRLGKIIYLYDDNHITIDGSTDLAFSEDRVNRFSSYGWHTQVVPDGNDIYAIDQAINLAKKDPRPSIISCHTHIGFGLPHKQDTSRAHGEPPGEEELNQAKINVGWPGEGKFIIPDEVLTHFREAVQVGDTLEAEWQEQFLSYKQEFPNLAAELLRRKEHELPRDWMDVIPSFAADKKGMGTRVASGKVMNSIAQKLPELIGGSADLTPSNNTWMETRTAFQADNPMGSYLHFGVREHGMGAIVNGMAIHGGMIPFGSTFLVFSDYMRGAIRVGALSHIPSIWIFTHDSIGVGEDGPTHQPVEHLASLRAIPGLVVIRPSDANETAEAWKVAVNRRNGPTALILTRQAVPTLDRTIYANPAGLLCGAYVLKDFGSGQPDIILMASGSEVSLIVNAGEKLALEGKKVRLVSFPSWELFMMQDQTYREQVLPPSIRSRVAVEAGIRQGWDQWVGDLGSTIGVEDYGVSAPANLIFEKFGLTVDAILSKVRTVL